MIFLPTLVICFLGISCGIYFLIPQRAAWYLAAVYSVGALLFGRLYVMIDNKTRLRHQDTLKRGWDIRNHLRASRKKIKVITRIIQKDGNEDLYDLEEYNDEITCVKQESLEIASRRKDTLGTLGNVTRTIISDEIIASHKDKLNRFRQELGEVSANPCSLENSIRGQNIRMADTHGPYLRREFLQPEKLVQLSRIIQAGSASNITGAIKTYQGVGQDVGRPWHFRYNSYVCRSCRLRDLCNLWCGRCNRNKQRKVH